MKTANISNDYIYIKFGNEDFQHAHTVVKSLPGRSYDYTQKQWTVPHTQSVEDRLRKEGFDFGDDVSIEGTPKDNSFLDKQLALPNFLYKYQREALQYLKHYEDRSLLAAFMGSGKTIMSLTSIFDGFNNLPALVVCPSSVKKNFLEDNRKFFGENTDVVILDGGDSLRKYKGKKVYVINYELLSRAVEKIPTNPKETNFYCRPTEELTDFVNSNFKYVVFDESHRLKNKEAKIYFAAQYLSNRAKGVLCMTGTPVMNNPSEIYPQMQLVNPKEYTDEKETYWLNKFCSPKRVHIGKGRYIIKYGGVSNAEELNTTLHNTGMFVIDKREAEKELPEVTRIPIGMELDRLKEYEDKKETILLDILENPQKKLTLPGRLMRLAVEHKMESIIKFIDYTLELQEKIIVFGIHQKTLQVLKDKYKSKAVLFNGTVSKKNKEQAVESFTNDPKTRLFLGNIASASEGLDGLQKSGCSTILFCEFPWTPSSLSQGEARLSRNGAIITHVNSYYMYGEGTIEEDIIKLLDDKQGKVVATMTGQEVTRDSLLSYLVNKYMAIAEKLKDKLDKRRN